MDGERPDLQYSIDNGTNWMTAATLDDTNDSNF